MKKALLLSCCFLLFVIWSYSQNVGIGSTNPLARLFVLDSNVIFSAPGNTPASPAPIPDMGFGRRLIWYADKAAFRVGRVSLGKWDSDSIGGLSIGMGDDALAKGISSVSIGSNNSALGTASLALGNTTLAQGFSSTSLGYVTSAIGASSLATGELTIARGKASTTLGHHTKSKSFSELVIGTYNDSADAANTNFFNPLNRLFQIGNGTADNLRSNALTVLQNGRMGLGVVIPLARLHVADSSVIFSAPGDVKISQAAPPVSGSGRRMMWYPDKAAFRAGYTDGGDWDQGNIGYYSTAFGNSTQASGIYSFAAGYNSRAKGQSSVALGNYSFANENSSVALGSNTLADDFNTVAIGTNTWAIGNSSIAIGYDSRSQAMHSSTFGLGLYARRYGSVVVGMYNDTTEVITNNLDPGNRVFQVGNGVTSQSRSTALTVLQNGSVGIGTNTPGALLDVNGKTTTNQLQVGAGSIMTNLQTGTFTVGASGSAFLSTTHNFPVAFSSAPKVIATAKHQPGYNVNDTFTVTVRSVSTTQVTFNIQRVDSNGGWAQNLLIDWMAIE